MSKSKVAVAVVVIISAAALWMIQHQNQTQLREVNEALRAQRDRVVQLEADNERLSNLLAQAEGSFSKKELGELLKLRSEAGALRQQTNELQKLRGQNDRLQAALKTVREPRSATLTNAPSESPPLAVYPRSSWSFAGFATPEAAFQSLNWAASSGDMDTFLANLTPDMQKEFAKQFETKSASEAADEMKNKINKNSEVRILAKEVISDNEVVFDIMGTQEGSSNSESDRPDKIAFQRINGQWKLAPSKH